MGHMVYNRTMGFNICKPPRDVYVYGHINKGYDHGSGLSPDPTPHQNIQHVNSNTKPLVYITRHKWWSVGRTNFVKVPVGREFRGSNPMDSNMF